MTRHPFTETNRIVIPPDAHHLSWAELLTASIQVVAQKPDGTMVSLDADRAGQAVTQGTLTIHLHTPRSGWVVLRPRRAWRRER